MRFSLETESGPQPLLAAKYCRRSLLKACEDEALDISGTDFLRRAKSDTDSEKYEWAKQLTVRRSYLEIEHDEEVCKAKDCYYILVVINNDTLKAHYNLEGKTV